MIKAPATDTEIEAMLETHKEDLPPEMVLWAFVLLDAMAVLKGKIISPSMNELGLDRSAEIGNMYDEYIARERRWFASEDEAPCSFRWICDELGLDHVAIRKGINSNGGPEYPW